MHDINNVGTPCRHSNDTYFIPKNNIKLFKFFTDINYLHHTPIWHVLFLSSLVCLQLFRTVRMKPIHFFLCSNEF